VRDRRPRIRLLAEKMRVLAETAELIADNGSTVPVGRSYAEINAALLAD